MKDPNLTHCARGFVLFVNATKMKLKFVCLLCEWKDVRVVKDI